MREDLSNRSTVSRKIPEIDSLYVYKTRHKAKFTRRQQLGIGYRYTQKKAIVQAGEDEIYTYHRTATIDGVTQGLTLVTKNSKYREVQTWFNEQIIAIESDNKLLDRFKKAKSTPQQIGLLYLY